MYYGTKRQTVPKGRGHVPDVHIVVILTLYPTPLLQSLQRPHGLVLSPEIHLVSRWSDEEVLSVFVSSLSHRRGVDGEAGNTRYIHPQPVSHVQN